MAGAGPQGCQLPQAPLLLGHPLRSTPARPTAGASRNGPPPKQCTNPGNCRMFHFLSLICCSFIHCQSACIMREKQASCRCRRRRRWGTSAAASLMMRHIKSRHLNEVTIAHPLTCKQLGSREPAGWTPCSSQFPRQQTSWHLLPSSCNWHRQARFGAIHRVCRLCAHTPAACPASRTRCSARPLQRSRRSLLTEIQSSRSF